MPKATNVPYDVAQYCRRESWDCSEVIGDSIEILDPEAFQEVLLLLSPS